jgi:hypothetical protein
MVLARSCFSLASWLIAIFSLSHLGYSDTSIGTKNGLQEIVSTPFQNESNILVEC